jgi:TPR repeat protein
MALTALALDAALAGCARRPQSGVPTLAHDAGNSALPDALASLPSKCDAGDEESCRKLADAYREGIGVPQDAARARMLLERACERGQGRSLACTDLAGYYQEGVGVARDQVKAREIFERACDGQEFRACGLLGVIYTEGLGVPFAPPFQRIGVDYFERACKGGHADSCWFLGSILRAGRGVRRDEARARASFQRACELGDSKGCDELKNKRKH